MSINMETGRANLKGRKSVFTYIQSLKDELKKVSWTSRDELNLSTKIVVWATLAFGMGTYGVDFIIKGSLEVIKNVIHFIFG